MLSLAVYYSIYQTQVIGTYNPRGDLAAYRAKVEEQPNLKCECQRQSIPFREFAVPTVTINTACDWVKADLAAETSSCRNLRLVGYCVTVRDACLQSETTIDWIMNEFNNGVVSSTSLLQEVSLNTSTQASFAGNFKVGELISSAPKKTISAWASANMPRLLKMTGDLAIRAKAQTKKVRTLIDNTDDDFWVKCAAARPIVCRGDKSGDDYDYFDYAIKDGGALPVDCTRDDQAPSCEISKVADGECHSECMSPECLFDGGDCAGSQVTTDNPEDLRQSFTLFDALVDPDQYNQWQEGSWLDHTPNVYVNASRLRCDDAERWAETNAVPVDQDLFDSKFAGFDFSSLASWMGVNKDNAAFPTVAGGTQPVEFRAAKSVGCDEYQKQLKSNIFQFYSVDEFQYFLGKMRELGEYAASNPSIVGSDYTANTDDEGFRAVLDTSSEDYVSFGYFNYLENMAAPLAQNHVNLDTAMDNLFVDHKNLEVNYEKYFTACEVSSCTYTYMSASSIAGIAAVIIGLLGGINNAMNATFKVVYAVMRTLVVKNSVVACETNGETVEMPANGTPSIKGSQANRSPV